MPEETPELPVSPQEVQIETRSFLDKLKTHKWKILGGILGVFVFAGAVFGAYKLSQRQAQPALQPTPTPVSATDWKTYTNTEYGYSVKYPESWDVIQLSRSEGDIIWIASFRPKEPPPTDPEYGLVTISVHKNMSSVSLGNYPTQFLCDAPGICAKKESVSVIKIRDLEGRKVVEPPGPVPSQVVLLKRDSQIYRIGIILDRSYEELYMEKAKLQLFEQILSTFRFLEESTGEKVFCQEPRPQVCTMECIVNPPYICGSDGKSYCSECQACADPDIEWYVIQEEPCGTE